MQIKCQASKLRECLTLAAHAAASRGDGVIRNVLARFKGDILELFGTDNEVFVAVKMKVEGAALETEVMLPTKRMQAILSEMADEDMMLIVDNNSVRVKASGVNFRLASESGDGFPRITRFSAESYFTIPGTLLRKMILRTVFATEAQSTRYALGGVLFELFSDTLRCVATDSRRMAMCEAAVEAVGDVPSISGVVPTKVLRLLDRLPDANVDVAMTDKSVFFRVEGFECSGRLVEGRFPRYRDVIPNCSRAILVSVNTGFAASAVRQAMVVTTEESRAVHFALSEGRMSLKSQSADVGSSEIELLVEADPVAETSVMLDPKYVADFLKCLPSESVVQWKLNGADTAVVLTDGEKYSYLMMPVCQD